MFTSTNANAIYNPRPLTEVIQDKQTQKLNEVFTLLPLDTFQDFPPDVHSSHYLFITTYTHPCYCCYYNLMSWTHKWLGWRMKEICVIFYFTMQIRWNGVVVVCGKKLHDKFFRNELIVPNFRLLCNTDKEFNNKNFYLSVIPLSALCLHGI